jgi:hypothetical protein
LHTLRCSPYLKLYAVSCAGGASMVLTLGQQPQSCRLVVLFVCLVMIYWRLCSVTCDDANRESLPSSPTSLHIRLFGPECWELGCCCWRHFMEWTKISEEMQSNTLADVDWGIWAMITPCIGAVGSSVRPWGFACPLGPDPQLQSPAVMSPKNRQDFDFASQRTNWVSHGISSENFADFSLAFDGSKMPLDGIEQGWLRIDSVPWRRGTLETWGSSRVMFIDLARGAASAKMMSSSGHSEAPDNLRRLQILSWSW